MPCDRHSRRFLAGIQSGAVIGFPPEDCGNDRLQLAGHGKATQIIENLNLAIARDSFVYPPCS